MSRETKADHDHFHSPVTPAPWSLVHPSPSVPPSLRGPYGADRNERRMNEWRDGPRGPGWGRIKGPRTPSPSGLRVCRSLLPWMRDEWTAYDGRSPRSGKGVRDMIAVNLSFSFRTPSISWLKRSGCKVSVTRREAAEIDGGRKGRDTNNKWMKEENAGLFVSRGAVSFSLTTFPSHYIRAAGGSEGGDRALRDHGTRPKAERRRERWSEVHRPSLPSLRLRLGLGSLGTTWGVRGRDRLTPLLSPSPVPSHRAEPGPEADMRRRETVDGGRRFPRYTRYTAPCSLRSQPLRGRVRREWTCERPANETKKRRRQQNQGSKIDRRDGFSVFLPSRPLRSPLPSVREVPAVGRSPRGPRLSLGSSLSSFGLRRSLGGFPGPQSLRSFGRMVRVVNVVSEPRQTEDLE